MASTSLSSPSSSSDPIIFYDIASGPPVHPFAPNPWKVRYALNFTKANYVTKWVELCDIKATRQSLGLVKPSRYFPNGEPYHTLPAMQDKATDTVLGDSLEIAVYLDKKYGGLLRNAEMMGGSYESFNAEMDSVFTTGAYLAAEGLPFNPATVEKDRAEFCRRAGVETWEQLIVSGQARRDIVGGFEVALGEVEKKYYLGRDGDVNGLFIGGEEPDYADFIVGGWLMFLARVVPEWVEIRTWQGGLWGRLHDGLEPYRGTW